MLAPSQLAIATSVLNRLIKEEKSYHKELEQQNVKIAKLEAGEDADNENAEFILRQQVSEVADQTISVSFLRSRKSARCAHHILILATQKQAVEQTKAVFPGLNQKILDALSKLEEQIVRLTNIFPW